MPHQPPEIRFARSGTVDLAYQVVGQGPPDIVVMIGWVSHLEVLWELPEVAAFLERLAGMGRVVIFDKRGTGLSERPSDVGSIGDIVPDVLAIMDEVGMDEAVLVGWVDAAVAALMVAKAHPDRVKALVLGEVLATAHPDEEHPWTPDPEMIEAVADTLELGTWGQGVMLQILAPSVADDERILSWFRKLERMSATPKMAADLLRRLLSADVRDLLPNITAPALVLHRKDAPLIPPEAPRWVAEQLPHGRYVEVPGDEIPGYLGDVDALMDEVEEFLIGTRVGAFQESRVVTIVFSDVVGSTERVATVGDRRWRVLLDTHRSEARQLVARYRGREMNTTGDGFLIIFDTPTLAIRFGRALCDAARSAGLQTRVGIHSGEVMLHDDDITGLAVHIAARVSALAPPDEVVISQTVRDMVIGSEFAVESLGRHELKGVPGTWEQFRVLPP
jgi:class 3 adenylate cyclase/pimeloyl-ACP methyl ester carboxylesterase